MKPAGSCPLCGDRPPLFAVLTACAWCQLRAGDAPRAHQDDAPEPPPPPRDERPALVVLVGCGKTKRDGTHQAGELYTGPIFTAGRRWAEQRIAQAGAGERASWWILSAKYGAIRPDERIATYDQRLPAAAEDARWWGHTAARTLTMAHLEAPRRRVVILAGADYADAIRPHLEADGWTVIEPLRGLGTGPRRSWMKNHAHEEARP